MAKLLKALVCLSVLMALFRASVKAKKAYYCSGKIEGVAYCTYEVGDPKSKLVINVPSSGILEPGVLPTRDAGCLKKNGDCVWGYHCGTKNFDKCRVDTDRDEYTDEIAVKVADNIASMTKIRPHIILNNLHLRKMDADHNINQATFKNPIAIDAYDEYHDFIRNATETVKGRGLFIDMHGHNHKSKWIELGYLLAKSDLNGNTLEPEYASVRGLFENSNDYTLEDLIRGDASLGYFLEKAGYAAMPSPKHPSPGKKPYLSGGYDIRQHGSLWNDRIDGVQISLPAHLRTRKKAFVVAKVLSEVIVKWMKLLY